jgi:hypothetical protein
VIFSLFIGGGPALGEDAVILDPRDHPIRTGAYSTFAAFQQVLDQRLRDCSRAAGPATRQSFATFDSLSAATIRAAVACGMIADLPESSPARLGVLTASVWQSVMGDRPPPALAEIVAVITLSFEDTDFTDPPQWNFCQDNPGPQATRAADALRNRRCINGTDPCSLLTWGPRGATAGQGREIQHILWRISRESLDLFSRAFGSELRSAIRFLHLPGAPPDRCEGTSATEHFMCAIWVNPRRRKIWDDAFRELGSSSLARQIYNEVYAGQAFDGEKLEAYDRLWRAIKLAPTEIDFAFFFDRSTHVGDPPDDPALVGRLRACIAKEPVSVGEHARARRCLSILHPHSTQPTDRVGRDVTFYVDAYPPVSLGRRELQLWQAHVPLRAAKNFGLSDERSVPPGKMLTSVNDAGPPKEEAGLDPDEGTCPLFILTPNRAAPVSRTPSR